MKSREFKDLTFEIFAKTANSFASPKRLEIIDLLTQGERDVDSLAKETNMNFANTSRHLQILKSANLVKTRREGVRIFYFISNNEVIRCWKSLQSLAEKTASEIREISRLFFEERDSLEPINLSDLKSKLENDEIMLIDVRPPEEFAQGHLPKAVSYPLSKLKDSIDLLSTQKEIVAYCRGSYCVLAAEAVKMLKEKGFNVNLSKEDINTWQLAGLPIEVEENYSGN
jgi:rhodanese-related sulfurtransferase/DNA-binding MarR family transcriptional regulator